ncbi:MAG: hypothetical protein Q7S31_02770 [bacterium]|nr:hypothetical protein [bacterium]
MTEFGSSGGLEERESRTASDEIGFSGLRKPEARYGKPNRSIGGGGKPTQENQPKAEKEAKEPETAQPEPGIAGKKEGAVNKVKRAVKEAAEDVEKLAREEPVVAAVLVGGLAAGHKLVDVGVSALKKGREKEEGKEEGKQVPATFVEVQRELKKLVIRKSGTQREEDLMDKQAELVAQAERDGVFGNVRKRVAQTFKDHEYPEAIELVRQMADTDPVHGEIDGSNVSSSLKADHHEMVREYCKVASEVATHSLRVVSGREDPRLLREIELRGWGSIPFEEQEIAAQRYLGSQVQNAPASPQAGPETETAGAKPGMSFKDMFPAVEYREKPGFASLFAKDGYFIKKYGFPESLKYAGGGLESIRRKTINMLTDAIQNGNVRPFESIDFINAAGEEFGWAYKSLFASRDRTKGGSWKELIGDQDGTPAALEGFNFKFAVDYLSKDERFVRAVNMLMAADGSLGEGYINVEDARIVAELVKAGYREWLVAPGTITVANFGLSKNELKEIEEGRKEPPLVLSQAELRNKMDEFSIKLAEHLGVDQGLVYLARQMVTFMGYGVEMEAARTIRAKKAKKDSVYGLVAQEKDYSLNTALEKAGIKGDYSGRLAKAFREGGFAQMAEVAQELKVGNEVFQWARGMKMIEDNLDEIDKMWQKIGVAMMAGSAEDYMKSINGFLEKMTTGTPPLMKPETAERIAKLSKERWDILEKGRLAAAAELTPEEQRRRAIATAGQSRPTVGGVTNKILGSLVRSIPFVGYGIWEQMTGEGFEKKKKEEE